MDDDLETAWQREKQIAEAREARERALADCDDMLAHLRERAAVGPVSPWQPPKPVPVRRQPQPKPRAEMAPPMPDKVQIPQHDASGRVTSITTYEGASVAKAVSWEGWVRAHVERQIATVYEAVGTVLREDVMARFDRIEKRLAELERVTGQGMREAADD